MAFFLHRIRRFISTHKYFPADLYKKHTISIFVYLNDNIIIDIFSTMKLKILLLESALVSIAASIITLLILFLFIQIDSLGMLLIKTITRSIIFSLILFQFSGDAYKKNLSELKNISEIRLTNFGYWSLFIKLVSITIFLVLSEIF
jgi:hypothetical protein